MVNNSIHKWLVLFIFSLSLLHLSAQGEIKDIKKGNNYYNKDKFVEAEVEYRKALEANPKAFEAVFNLGDALYRQEKYSEAAEQFKSAAAISGQDKSKLAASYHNLGNALLQENKIEQSIEAYKNALRNDPSDHDTRYNLAYAQHLLKQQEQQQDQQDQQQDKQDQQQEQQEQEQQQDQQQQDQQQQDQQEQQQEQQNESQMSRENAEQILKALEQDEKEVQERVKENQNKSSKRFNVEKDW